MDTESKQNKAHNAQKGRIMTVAERWKIANGMAEARHPFTGNPYSVADVEANDALVKPERRRLIDDFMTNGDNSELAQEIARRQSVGA